MRQREKCYDDHASNFWCLTITAHGRRESLRVVIALS